MQTKWDEILAKQGALLKLLAELEAFDLTNVESDEDDSDALAESELVVVTRKAGCKTFEDLAAMVDWTANLVELTVRAYIAGLKASAK